MLLGNVLAQSLKSNQTDVYLIFKPVQDLIEESIEEIDKITSRGPNFEIYKTRAGGVSYWYFNLPDYLKPAVAEFNQLLSFSTSTLSKKDQRLVNPQLAHSLSIAFNSQENEDVLRGFKKVENFINIRANSNTHFWYIFYNSVLFFLICIVLLLLYFYSDISKVFVVGAAGGLVGAFLSILTRIDQLALDILAPFRNVFLQGYSRLLVGIISGLFIIVASRSNLILGTYSESIYSLVVFCLISGFSERFVPDLISTISTKQIGVNEEIAK